MSSVTGSAVVGTAICRLARLEQGLAAARVRKITKIDAMRQELADLGEYRITAEELFELESVGLVFDFETGEICEPVTLCQAGGAQLSERAWRASEGWADGELALALAERIPNTESGLYFSLCRAVQSGQIKGTRAELRGVASGAVYVQQVGPKRRALLASVMGAL